MKLFSLFCPSRFVFRICSVNVLLPINYSKHLLGLQILLQKQTNTLKNTLTHSCTCHRYKAASFSSVYWGKLLIFLTVRTACWRCPVLIVPFPRQLMFAASWWWRRVAYYVWRVRRALRTLTLPGLEETCECVLSFVMLMVLQFIQGM